MRILSASCKKVLHNSHKASPKR